MAELRRHDIDLGDEVIRVRRAVVKLVGAPGGHIVGEPKSRAGIRDVTIPPHLLGPSTNTWPNMLARNPIRCCSHRCPVARTIYPWRRTTRPGTRPGVLWAAQTCAGTTCGTPV